MKCLVAATVACTLAVLGCGGDSSGTKGPGRGILDGGGAGGPGGDGGGAGGDVLAPGGAGGGSAGEGGGAGEGGSGGMGGVAVNPFDPNWGPCLDGPPRRPSTGTALQNPDAPFQLPPLQTDVEHYELSMSGSDFSSLRNNPREDTMYPATFEARGERHEVLVRYRGNSSRGWPKKSWRIELPEGSRFDGRRKLNLLSGWQRMSLRAFQTQAEARAWLFEAREELQRQQHRASA